MEDFYRLDPAISCYGEIAVVPASSAVMEIDRRVDNMFQFEADEQEMSRSEISSLIKDQIANHPRYPNLVTAYIECRKVGASPKMASLLEKIARENNPSCCSSAIGADPELDKFMDSYCEVLHRYKEELSKQFDEASSFLSNIKVQLSDLCKVASSSTTTTSSSLFGNSQSDEAPGTSEEELSCGEVEVVDALESCGPHPGDEDLKEMLLRKYSGYLSSLRKEFMRNRKKGKLPTDARMVLLDWWNCHYKWPYPSEEEKIQLSEASGLDYKQINNWFINQRKRHWKPSEDIRFALVDHIAGDSSEPQIHQRNWQ